MPKNHLYKIIVCLLVVSTLTLPVAAGAQTGNKASDRKNVDKTADLQTGNKAADGKNVNKTADARTGKDTAKAELKWKPFEAAFDKARGDDKKVLLDVYTDWCVWCKRLDSNVYTDQRVVSYLGKHYVVVKMNAEDTTNVTYKTRTSTKVELAHAFGVRGYPTIIFFDSKGEAITSIPGYVDANRFLAVAKFIGEDYYKKMTWDNYQKMSESGSPKE